MCLRRPSVCRATFCLECLEKYGEDERPGDEMPCPLCQQMFKIPDEGFKKLPNNIFIEQILANVDIFQDDSPSKEVKCEVCDNGESNKYCVELRSVHLRGMRGASCKTNSIS